ncbi:MAG: hypothetical protein KKI08_11010, partial [Armatimonadetes bacterium]|nr:hypothetical protein [Armatimonadota bacterium]
RLWSVFIRIRDAKPKPPVKGWMGSNEIGRFGQTASYYRKGGGKHNVLPARPMSQRDGEEFVRKLIGLWLDWKLAQNSAEPKPE